MHLAEGILPLTHSLAWSVVAAPVVGFGLRRLQQVWPAGPSLERAILGMAGALTFAVTLFPVPVPVIGATSHMCATPLLALLLGVRLMVVPTLASLFVQALFFAHGGLTTLGANIVSLAVVGPCTALVLARLLRLMGAPIWLVIGVSCACADLAVYVFDAVVLGAALQGDYSFTYWFSVVLLGFAPVQGPLALLEGLLSVALLYALAQRRPDLLPPWLRDERFVSKHVPVVSTAVGFFLVLWWTPPLLAAERYLGIDETVISAAAEAAGRPASPPLFDLGQGELPLFLFSFGSFIAGCVVGAGWVRLGTTGTSRHASTS